MIFFSDMITFKGIRWNVKRQFKQNRKGYCIQIKGKMTWNIVWIIVKTIIWLTINLRYLHENWLQDYLTYSRRLFNESTFSFALIIADIKNCNSKVEVTFQIKIKHCLQYLKCPRTVYYNIDQNPARKMNNWINYLM